ncbi:MAG: DUF1801 domain-containing protein [Hyphomonas sp.]
MKTAKAETIESYNAAQAPGEREICEVLKRAIDAGLPGAESRIWHAHPVWFLEGNPIAGYSKLKHCVRLLFWSGQSFETPGLAPEGTFKAAEARTVQWDYKNLVKRNGRLERLM